MTELAVTSGAVAELRTRVAKGRAAQATLGRYARAMTYADRIPDEGDGGFENHAKHASL